MGIEVLLLPNLERYPDQGREWPTRRATGELMRRPLVHFIKEGG